MQYKCKEESLDFKFDELLLYKILDFIFRIKQNSFIIRIQLILEYIVENEQLDLNQANEILLLLIDEGVLEPHQSDTYPYCTISDTCRHMFNSLWEKYGPLIPTNHSKYYTNISEDLLAEQKQQEIDIEKEKSVDENEPFSNEEIYQFLKFIYNVLDQSNIFYLRPLVAENYIRETMGFSASRTRKFLQYLIDNKFIEDTEFQIYSGYVLTANGRDYFEHQISNN
jgi:hypothetical protein